MIGLHGLAGLGADAIDTIKNQIAALNDQLQALIAARVLLDQQGTVSFGTEQGQINQENLQAQKNANTEQQNAVQSQINSLSIDLQKAENTQASSPAFQANAERAEVEKAQRQLVLFGLPGRYDFGMRSAERRRFYKESGVSGRDGLSGVSMNGLYAMDRPTMGFDIWSAVAQGVQEGVKQYQNDPNKPKIKLDLPKISGAPKIQLPSWLRNTAKVVAKPVSTVGKQVFNSVKAAQDKDRRDAAARAASVGSDVIGPSAQLEAPSSGIPSAAIYGALALLAGGVFLMRRRA